MKLAQLPVYQQYAPGFSRPRRREWIETFKEPTMISSYNVSPVLDGGSGLKQRAAVNCYPLALGFSRPRRREWIETIAGGPAMTATLPFLPS